MTKCVRSCLRSKQDLVIFLLIFLGLNCVDVSVQRLPAWQFSHTELISAERNFQAWNNVTLYRVSVSHWHWSAMHCVPSYHGRQRATRDVLFLSCALTLKSSPPLAQKYLIAYTMPECSSTHISHSQFPSPHLIQTRTK